MLKVIVNRLLQGILVIFVLFTLTSFLIQSMPGNPLQNEKAQSEKTLEQNRKLFGLDGTKFEVYVRTLKNYAHGNFGLSTKKGQPVAKIISESFPNSVILGILATIIAILIGIPAGILAALKKNSLLDYSTMFVAMIGISIPSFVIGPILAVLLGRNVSFLNVAGWGVGPLDWVLPAITLGLATSAYLARITRAGMLDVLSQDYIRTARAKGLSTRQIIFKHALRGGLIPSVTYLGPAFAIIITGSFVVETIFQVPGMGQHFVNATRENDLFLLQGMVVLFGLLIVFANLASDLLLAFLNPRLRN